MLNHLISGKSFADDANKMEQAVKSNVIRVHTAGGPEVLKLESVDVPPPGEGEVLIRHNAIGVNLIDTYHRSMDAGQYAIARPATLGVEAAGVVEALGSGVESVKVGDRVAYWNFLGAYAERRIVPAWRLVPIPDDISDQVAAAALLKGATAYYLLHRIWSVKKGDSVLIHAAAGGVGTLLCQWANHLGATVIGTVGSPEKVNIAQRSGCSHVILYREQDFVTEVRRVTDGKGVNVVFDSVGRDTFSKSLDCLCPLGMMVNFGQASGPVDPLDISVLAQKGSLFLAKPTLATFTQTRGDLLELANGVYTALRVKGINVEIGHSAPLAEAPEVHRILESRKTTGSTLFIL
jgi:NADPH:quinone reductase